MKTLLTIDGEALPNIVRRVTVTVRTATTITDLGNSFVYEKIADGTLETTAVGGRRLIYLDSLMAMVGLAPDGSRLPGAGTYMPTRKGGRTVPLQPCDTEPQAEPPKRQRGRPRKTPLPAEG